VNRRGALPIIVHTTNVLIRRRFAVESLAIDARRA